MREIAEKILTTSDRVTKGEWTPYSSQKGAGEEQWISNINEYGTDHLSDEEYEKHCEGERFICSVMSGREEVPQDRDNFEYLALAANHAPQLAQAYLDSLQEIKRLTQENVRLQRIEKAADHVSDIYYEFIDEEGGQQCIWEAMEQMDITLYGSGGRAAKYD